MEDVRGGKIGVLWVEFKSGQEGNDVAVMNAVRMSVVPRDEASGSSVQAEEERSGFLALCK